ncbi:hypothetical protein [Albimonas pacifica]|uniref:Uncharacterized protein n=1 Tax=Albimonas pacifica TaxID=1114924 RepID=A0A1I3HMS5_9RHOB|nr:hypothetical protein [Albimonas pacifica]SFI36962.1 hypothetical protein SAMN05216258_10678 [Albimonas pacifica]
MPFALGLFTALALGWGGAVAQTTAPSCPDTHVPCGGACCAK